MSELIYGPYDQKSLDLEYDMRIRCPHFAETFARLEADCERAWSSGSTAGSTFPSARAPLERLDIWPG